MTAGVWLVRADLLDGVGILGNLVGPVVLEPWDGEDALHAGFCRTGVEVSVPSRRVEVRP